jgi:surface-adhesin protein E
MKALFIASALVAAVAMPALGQWVRLGTSDNAAIAVDTSSIKRSGSSRLYWSRVEYFVPVNGFSRIDTYQRANCNQRRIRTVETRGYDMAGQLVERSLKARTQDVVPDTLDGLVFEKVCN